MNDAPAHVGPRTCYDRWVTLGADKTLLAAINKGVKMPLKQPPKPLKGALLQQSACCDEIINDYLKNGAIKELTEQEKSRTKSWTPIFLRAKQDDKNKFRLITDMRNINKCAATPKHKQEKWTDVVNMLQDKTLLWGITLDLKDWFHNLSMHPKTQRWMRFQYNNKAYQIIEMPFGWTLAPWWSTKLSKPIRSWLHDNLIPHAWFVDDVLIMGTTKDETEQRAAQLINLLTQLGVKINKKKSMTQASQEVRYLGHLLNFRDNLIKPILEKLKNSQKMALHQKKGNTCQPKNLAALAGNLLDAEKSNLKLRGLPQQLMKLNARVVKGNANKLHLPLRHAKVWGVSAPKPPGLQELLRDVIQALAEPVAKIFRGGSGPCYTLHSDASDQGWGAKLYTEEGKQFTVAEFCGTWDTPQEKKQHITAKEATASALAVRLAVEKIQNGSTLSLRSDATSTVYAWKKGSKVRAINTNIQQSACLATLKNIFVQAEHIKGENNQADRLSRLGDPKSYMLKPSVFREVCGKFNYSPRVDLFASSTNKQVKHYCSWKQDAQSWGNAFDINWRGLRGYCNPPWELLGRVLDKVKKDKAQVMLVAPVWRAAPWWRKLLLLQQAPLWILKNKAIFQGPNKVWLPPPRWATCFTIVGA